MTKPDPTSSPMPSTSEKGYVTRDSELSQWNQNEKVPSLQWPQSVEVFSRMESEDSRVSSLLAAIGLPIRRTPWRIAQAGASDEVTEFVARNLGLPIQGAGDLPDAARTRDRFSWPQHLAWALDVLQFGHSVFEQLYRREGDRLVLRKLAPRPQSTISKWNVAADGGLVSIEQQPPELITYGRHGFEPIEIPVSHLVVYTRDMAPGMWIGKSLLRPSYKHWLLKDELIRLQAVAIRRNGIGVPVGTTPDNADQKLVDRMAEIAQSYRGGETAGVGLPGGTDLKLLGVQGNLPDIQQAISYHDKAIALAGLAHFLNLDGGGSYALANVQADTFTQSVQTFAESVRDTANAHVIEDLVDVNWGPDEPAPRLIFDEIGSQQPPVAAALKMLVEAGLLSPDVLVEQDLRQRLGLPARTPDTPAPAVPAATSEGAPA